MMKRAAFVVTLGAAALGTSATASTARAEGTSANAAAAQELFNQGRTLMGEGRFAEAFPKLAESQRLDPGMGTEFNLAECEEKLGKTASAWAHYLDVADAAKVAGQAAREKFARGRAAQLETHLARLVVTSKATTAPATVAVAPANAAPTPMEIRRDGVIVGSAQYGVAVPVDPGEHRITATAPGKKSWERTVRTPADATSAVDVPALEDLPREAVAALPVAPTGPSQEELDREQRAKVQKIAGIAVAGVGVVGLGIGSAFGLISKGKHDDVGNHCNGDSCDPTGVSLRSDAMHAGNVSTIAFAVGGAALIGGGVLYFTAPKDREHPDRAALSASPLVGPGTGGVAFAGHF